MIVLHIISIDVSNSQILPLGSPPFCKKIIVVSFYCIFCQNSGTFRHSSHHVKSRLHTWAIPQVYLNSGSGSECGSLSQFSQKITISNFIKECRKTFELSTDVTKIDVSTRPHFENSAACQTILNKRYLIIWYICLKKIKISWFLIAVR